MTAEALDYTHRQDALAWPGAPRLAEYQAPGHFPSEAAAMALFCKTRTTTRRFSASPSVVFSLPICSLSPIAPGASILVRGTLPC